MHYLETFDGEINHEQDFISVLFDSLLETSRIAEINEYSSLQDLTFDTKQSPF